MTTTDQYLKRATRGLWGQKKREAVTELRGAIEDKIYQHRLCGLDELEAERAALRDLGSPAAIARDLNRVHTGPQVARMTLLLGVAGLLGVRAVAQIPTIRAAPVPLEEACTFDEAKLARYSPEDRAMVVKRISAAGGRANYEAECRARQPGKDDNALLRLADVIAALRAARIDVQTLPGLDAYLQLHLPGGDWQGVDLTYATIPVSSGTAAQASAAETYIYGAGLLNALLYSFTGPLRLTGVVNPTLHLGPAQMQLGTAEHPVRATNLYMFPVTDELSRLMAHASSGPATLPRISIAPDQNPNPAMSRLAIDAPDGRVYALVGSVDGGIEVTVRAAQGGTLELPCDCRTTPFSQTGDLNTLLDWARQGETGLLVYAVDVQDLRKLTLTPVPVAQTKVVHP